MAEERPPEQDDPNRVLLQGLGVDVAQMRRELRRRVALLLVGAAVVLVGVQIDPRALGLPVFSPALVGMAGGLVALGGLLGLRQGAGCLAQILFLVLLGALTCGVGARDPVTLQVIGVTAVVLATLAFVLSRRRRAKVGEIVPPGSPAARSNVIDVEAREVRED